MHDITAGMKVKRVAGKPEEIGQIGLVREVLGTLAGDTGVTVAWFNAPESVCYTRQIAPF